MPKKTKIILVVICLGILFTSGWLYYDYYNNRYAVYFLDVGQGDAVLIDLPGNNEILIDGGPDISVLNKLGKYLPVYNRDIELIVLTHPHADHVTGLVEVLNRYQVKKVLTSSTDYSGSAIYDAFLNKIKNKNVVTPFGMDEINFDQQDSLQILFPKNQTDDKNLEDVNNASIVIKAILNTTNFLFMGDAEIPVEEKILENFSNANLDADILKVGHHGSNSSSGQEFIEKVLPDWSIISVGQDNSYGLPSLRVIRRLENLDSQVFQTKDCGDIIFDLKNNKVKSQFCKIDEEIK